MKKTSAENWMWFCIICTAVACILNSVSIALPSEVTEITIEAEVVQPIGPMLQAVSVNVFTPN